MILMFQAQLVENLGKVNFEEEIKKRFKMVYVHHWFAVDLKLGVKIVLSQSVTCLSCWKCDKCKLRLFSCPLTLCDNI